MTKLLQLRLIPAVCFRDFYVWCVKVVIWWNHITIIIECPADATGFV